jgi:hypothetical protein
MREGLRPAIFVLELVEDITLPLEQQTPDCKTLLDLCEKWWIAKARISGWPILNLQDGGQGGDTLSNHPNKDAIYQRIGDKLRGRPLSEEHRRKIGEAHKGVPHSQETRDAISKAMTGNPKAANGGRVAAENRRQDPEAAAEFSRKMSEISRSFGTAKYAQEGFLNKMQDPEFAKEHRQRAQKIGTTYGRENGLRAAELRFQCDGCTMVTTPGALARHQKASGHQGRLRVDTNDPDEF